MIQFHLGQILQVLHHMLLALIPRHVNIVIPFCVFQSYNEGFFNSLFICVILLIFSFSTMAFIWEIVMYANIIVTRRNDIQYACKVMVERDLLLPYVPRWN